MATYDQLIESFQRESTILVKITIKSPVTSNDVIFRFSPRQGRPINLQLGEDVRPYLLREPRGRPPRIRSDGALTERGRLTLNFADDEEAPDFDSAQFTVNTGLTFWKRLTIAQPKLIGSPIEVLRGFVDIGFIESSFKTIFKGRLEDINFSGNGEISIIAKDNFAFNDRQVPGEISDSNTVNANIGISDDTFEVDKLSEITNPTSLNSKDFFPVTLRLDPDTASEDVIVKSLSGSTVRIQDNFVSRSEELDDAAWTKLGGATVTPDTDVGPFGGTANADKVSVPSVGDDVRQTTAALSASATYTYSVWIKGSRKNSTPGTISIQTLRSDLTNFNLITVTLSKDWQRFEVVSSFPAGAGTVVVCFHRLSGDTDEFIAFGVQLELSTTRGFYVGTTTNEGADAGRGTFGSTAAAHTAPVAFREVLIYRNHLADNGVHPIVCMRDLVNRGELLTSEVDQSSFDEAFLFQETLQFKRSGVTTADRPRNLARLIREVSQQALIDLWVSEEGQAKAKFSWRINIPGGNSKTLNDSENIIFQSSEYKGNAESRVTRVFVYYNLASGADGDKPEDFDNVEVFVDLDAEEIAKPRSKTIFSKWIFRSTEALGTAGRLVSRFKFGARIAKWSVDIKEDRDFFTGDFIILDSRDIPVASGAAAVQGTSNWQVMQKDPKHTQGKINIEALEASGLRYAIISPAVTGKNDPFTGVPGVFPLDFDDATADDKQYGFIGDANNLVGDSAELGYHIL